MAVDVRITQRVYIESVWLFLALIHWTRGTRHISMCTKETHITWPSIENNERKKKKKKQQPRKERPQRRIKYKIKAYHNYIGRNDVTFCMYDS